MGSKILVELDIEDLKNICNSRYDSYANLVRCDGCKQDIKTLIRCNLYCSNFKIKDQDNETKENSYVFNHKK